MGELLIKERDIVVPGDVLATGMDFLPAGGAYREKESIIASQVGMVNISGRLVKVVALNGKYIPQRGETVIGQISDMGMKNWFVDIGYLNEAVIPLRDASTDYITRDADLTQYYNYGDYVVAGITRVTKSKQIDLTMKGLGFRKLTGGRIIRVNSAKIPRIIGKEGSMIGMIKQMTECRIIVGQNGFVWISSFDVEKERIAVEAIKMIEKNAHIQGLTEEIKSFLEKELGGKSDIHQEK